MIEYNSKSNRTLMENSLYSFETREKWVSDTLHFFFKTIQEKLSLSSNSFAHVILSGGNTPIPIYRKFSTLNLPWHRVHFWLADERCVSKDDPDRSETEIKKVLGDRVLKAAIFHSFPEGDPATVANIFEEELKDVTEFTISFLGIGEDGHTASLFPGFNIGEGESSQNILPIYNSPKPPAERVSLSLHCINRSEHVIFLVNGPKKKEIINQVMSGKDFPAAKVHGKLSSQIFFCME